MDVNANYMSTYSALSRPTLYPSAYMVVNSKGYTKHYYAGAERVAARIGGGGLDALISLADGGDSLRTKASHLFTKSIGQVNNRVLENNEPDCITGSVAEQDELKVWIEGIPEQLQASTLIDYGEFTDVIQSLRADHNGGQEREVYFYHSDHLGSASWITDSGGQAIQHLQYLPYGEPYINQRTSGYNERFTFTGKERDSETGYGYFGARYMDHELMTMWLSVDPLADKYPSISPYAYCAWNPIRLVDPNGEEIYFKEGNSYYIYRKGSNGEYGFFHYKTGREYDGDNKEFVGNIANSLAILKEGYYGRKLVEFFEGTSNHIFISKNSVENSANGSNIMITGIPTRVPVAMNSESLVQWEFSELFIDLGHEMAHVRDTYKGRNIDGRNEGTAMLTENLIRVEHYIRQRTTHGLIKTGKDDFKTDFDVELAPIVPQGIGIDSNGKFRRVIWNGTIYE